MHSCPSDHEPDPARRSCQGALGLLLGGLLCACSPGSLTSDDGQAEPDLSRGTDAAGPVDQGEPRRPDSGPLLRDLRVLPDDVPRASEDAGPLCPPGGWPRAFRATHEPSGGSGGALGDSELTVQTSGESGSVLLHAPTCGAAGALFGLVVALHDADGNREYLRYKWQQAAAERGYVVALPLAQRSYVQPRNWLENQEKNTETVRRTVEAVAAAYNIDRQELLFTGLGVGANFANLLATADATGLFRHLLLVNGNVWDPALEVREVKTFIILGQDSPDLAHRPPSEFFRFLHVAGLGPYYPGPTWPPLVGDPVVAEIDPTRAADWFFP